jgi:hypothetical protein
MALAGDSGRKFPSCSIPALNIPCVSCIHAIICAQHGTILSRINVLKSLCISYMTGTATPFCFPVTPSEALLCKVGSIDR